MDTISTMLSSDSTYDGYLLYSPTEIYSTLSSPDIILPKVFTAYEVGLPFTEFTSATTISLFVLAKSTSSTKVKVAPELEINFDPALNIGAYAKSGCPTPDVVEEGTIMYSVISPVEEKSERF